MKTALILGVSGQDGAYLSRFLLQKNYAVHGTSRDAEGQSFARLHALDVRNRVVAHTLPMADVDALRRIIESVGPDEIYNLSGLSSVALSFSEPAMARTSVAETQMLLLETVHSIAPASRVYHSASSECFGNPAQSAADERTPFAPLSPYAEAKAAAHRATIDFRATHGLYACSGIAFNHESPLRGESFVTKKIFSAAAAIAAGTADSKLHLGDLAASRDWGYAAEYVEAMWLMLQQEHPDDFVIATGESHTVEELAAAAFAEFDLDYRQHIVVDDSLMRPAELRHSRGNATRAREVLGWEARTKFSALVRLLANAARAQVDTSSSRPRNASRLR